MADLKFTALPAKKTDAERIADYNDRAQRIRDAINAEPLTNFISLTPSGKTGYVCPICGSGTGTHHTGALSIRKSDNCVTCFSASHPGDKLKTGTDTLGAIRTILNCSERDAFEYCGYSLDGSKTVTAPRATPTPAKKPDEPPKPLKDYRYDIDKWHAALKGSPAEAVLKRRGLTDETIERWKLGYTRLYQHGLNGAEAIVIPYPDTTNSYHAERVLVELLPEGDERKGRKYDKPNSDEAGSEPVFNLQALYSGAETVFVVESQLCAISIEQVGGHAVAIGGQGATKLVKAIKEKPTDATLVVCLDNDPHEPLYDRDGAIVGYKDEKTRKSADELRDKLLAIHCNAMSKHDLFGECKDANEFLQKDSIAFTGSIRKLEADIHQRNVEAAAATETTIEAVTAEQTDDQPKDEPKQEDYNATSAAGHLDDFDAFIGAKANTPPISTGFEGLDDILGGGLFEGLYIIGALTSLGKTSWILQIIDQIADQGTDCLIFSLEMARYELMAKSISRLTFQLSESFDGKRAGFSRRNAKTTRGITNGALYTKYSAKDLELIDIAKAHYATRMAQHIWIEEGIGDIGVQRIRERIQQHIDKTGRKPVVLVDYLQILSQYVDEKAPNRGLTDKQSVDKNVLELKRISRDFKIPVITVSSFNRSSYAAPVNNAAFKESGAVEYSADVLIGLQYTGMERQELKGSKTDADGNRVLEADNSPERLSRIARLLRKVDDDSKKGMPVEIDVKILKNRNGTRGMSNTMDFYAKFNTFIENPINRR